MHVVTVAGYKLYTCFDRDETIVAYTTSETTAIQWEKRSNYNGYCKVNVNYQFIDNLEELVLVDTANKRRAALAKLTDAERQLLGLELE